jgi:MoaA/NifB/PqqE/SkfB family radical SAM enzyme
MDSKEWAEKNKWNPFNSHKLLSHIGRWQYIQEGTPAPHPVLVTLDPINKCNLNCVWCNSDYILKKNNHIISKDLLMRIGDFLGNWKNNYKYEGVRAICIAGGGEPLLHPSIGEFIKKVFFDYNIEVGVVTNGTMINRHLYALSHCTWVGVSVDAGTAKVFEANKGKNLFHQVITNIEMLNNQAEKSICKLGTNIPGYGVTYKYLLHSGNYSDVYKAVKLAKEIGCKQFHLRPYGVSWDKLPRKTFFTLPMKRQYLEQIEQARSDFEDDKFRVYGITHKFDESFSVGNTFKNWWAMFMNGVFMPGSETGTYTFGLCCDRRGSSKTELVRNSSNPMDVEEVWGGKKHWDLFRGLNVKKCPRCTYQPHNQIYENVILNDNMTWKFI